MKKSVFFILFTSCILSLLLMACGLSPSSTSIINKSSYDVFFQRSREDTKIETLSPNALTSIKYFHTGIIILQPEKRIKQERDDHIITLMDLPSWEVYAENKTNNPITLTANGWMDKLTVPVGDFADLPSQKGIVYTKNPDFSVDSNTFPFNIQWQFVDNIFYVVIRD